ncbi:MAG: NAD(+) synthase [Clostridiales bacterium]|nr:NAD(+) synthase [Clostridiales bacterium]
MKDGFIRVGSASPKVRVADVEYNVNEIIRLSQEADEKKCSLLVFPELSITGYTCGDLFLQDQLQEAALTGLYDIAEASCELNVTIVVGLPYKFEGKLYNVAAVVSKGEVIGIVPKRFIPNYSEFYELRYFEAFEGEDETEDGIPFGNLVFRNETYEDFTFGIEICEDLWVADPPSVKAAVSGATIICNLSASDEVIGKRQYREKLVSMQSGRLICGYIYSDCGFGESTQDLVFAGHRMICENGSVINESECFGKPGVIYADLDLHRLAHDRLRNSFENSDEPLSIVYFDTEPETDLKITRKIASMPFVPEDIQVLSSRCEEIITMQAAGLAKRLSHINGRCAVVGLSGGLDSTLALIVTVHAFDMLDIPREGIIAVTMPGFGTTSRTKNNSVSLAEAYGVTLKTVDIKLAVRQHFEDIGQSEDDHDVTYENAQARERTQILMDIANKNNGIVIGTGDLSELALGWATYNGDHMSMYGVNSSIPKTLIRHLVSYEASKTTGELSSVLKDVVATPVSPELLPPDGNGEISQKTEDLVGPYELHDFFLYYFLRWGFKPSKIYRLANIAFEGRFSPEIIYKWEETFIRRFFNQQFKRSCLPDGPKVGTVTLSPRGDWRMPSDAVSKLWLDDLKSVL